MKRSWEYIIVAEYYSTIGRRSYNTLAIIDETPPLQSPQDRENGMCATYLSQELI